MNAHNNTYQQYVHDSSSKQEQDNPERRHLATASDRKRPKTPNKVTHNHEQVNRGCRTNTAPLDKNHVTSVKQEHRKDQEQNLMAEDMGIDANSNSDEDK